MTIASDLLQRHFETLVEDNARWRTLLADDILWELPFAPAIGHPARLSGREVVVRHVTWFLGAVENFRFFDVKVYAFADPEAAVAEFKAEGLIKSTRRIYAQNYVLFLRAAGGTIPCRAKAVCCLRGRSRRRARGGADRLSARRER